MKHLLLIFSALLFSAGTSFGQVLSEDFSAGSLPAGWTATSVSIGDAWEFGGQVDFGPSDTINDASGNLGEYAHIDFSDDPDTTSLITPVVSITSLTSPILSFEYITQTNSTAFNPFNRLLVDYWDGTSWVNFATIDSLTPAGWTYYQYDISAYTFNANDDVQFRFSAQEGGVAIGGTGTFTFEQDLALDEVLITEAPTCPAPTGLVVSNVTGSSVDITWTDNAGASEWEVEYGPVGYTTGTGTSTLVSTTTPTITGLASSTAYTFCVRAVCTPGDSSFWLCSGTVTTPCSASPAPFIESFTTNSLPNCWSEAGPTTWEYGSSATTPTGPAGWGATGVPDYSTPPTGTFIMMDGSDNTTGEVSILTSPFIDASTLTVPMMSYAVYYNNENDNTQNELLVEFWDGAAWNTVETINQNQGTNWVEYSTVVAGFTITGDVQMRFTVTGGVGTTFYNDVLLDDIELKEAPPCPNPSGLTLITADDTSAELSWSNGYLESEWTLEYGPVGFTPGTGTSVIAPTNPDTLTGLTPNQFYDVYVYANCSVTDTSDAIGPLTINSYNQGLYMEANNLCPTNDFVDISTSGVLNTLGDDGEVTISLPFFMLYQGEPISDITIGSNGAIILAPGQQVGFTNGTMAGATNGLYPFWDDLGPEEAGEGVFYQTIGTAPNQTFIIQWNKDHLGGNTNPYIFQLQIDEATNEIYFVYDDVEVGNAGIDFGGSATIGVAGTNQDIQISQNNTQYLTDETCVNFYYTDCPKPINYNVAYTTTDEAAISWGSGLSNETEWQVIYGVEGFDPLTGGASVTVTSPALIIPGLDDVTVYDVYILALCANGDTSFALTGQFETLPNCADITGLAGATAIDSIFTLWNFTPNTGFPISEFAMEYGPTGFQNGGGTFVYGIDTTNYTDTLFDVTLMSGGLYDVYIQSICLTGDSSNFVGPITVTMPLTNDSTCLSQAIPVDNVSYTFNGTGAGVSPGEINIAPPAGPCDGNMTWCNSSITASTWYTFVAPASGNVRIDGETADFDGQVAIYETSDCADFNQYNLIGANDDFNLTGDDFPYLNLCGLTPGNTYYMVHDPNGSAGIYSLRLQEIVVEAGTDNGLLDICLGDTVNLNSQLTGADANGTWTEDILTAGFNDPIWASTGLASQVYTFEYSVVDGCANDSVQTSVQVYAPSFAGNDNTITACQNQPLNLFSGLVGSVGVDFTGTWINPQNNALPTADIITGSIPGLFNYDYIAGNGVCIDDTANIVVEILLCDYLDLQEATFEGMDVYPNPTANVFYISNAGSSEVFNYELTDLNGKVITEKEAAINGVETTEVNVENLETGIYLIRIFNENAEKTYRVVKQ